MATTRRSQHDENDQTESTGRRQDSRGRFVAAGDDDHDEGTNGSSDQNRGAAGATEAASRGGRNSHGGQGGSQPAGGTATQPGTSRGSGSKQVISRAVRVLREIETRIHELYEELEHQSGGTGSTGSQSGGEDVEQGHQGRVKHPESDRRLKQNRDGNRSPNDGHDEDDDTPKRPTRARPQPGGRPPAEAKSGTTSASQVVPVVGGCDRS